MRAAALPIAQPARQRPSTIRPDPCAGGAPLAPPSRRPPGLKLPDGEPTIAFKAVPWTRCGGPPGVHQDAADPPGEAGPCDEGHESLVGGLPPGQTPP